MPLSLALPLQHFPTVLEKDCMPGEHRWKRRQCSEAPGQGDELKQIFQTQAEYNESQHDTLL